MTFKKGKSQKRRSPVHEATLRRVREALGPMPKASLRAMKDHGIDVETVA